MRHRARPKLLGVVPLPDRSRRSSSHSDHSRPGRTVFASGRPTRVAAAVAGGLVLAGAGTYAVTTLVDEPESPYAGAGPTPDRTDERPVSRGSGRPPLSQASSPSGGSSSTSPGDPGRTPAGADRAPAASKESSSSSPSPDLPSPTEVAGEAGRTAGEATPDTTRKRDGADRQRAKRDGAGASAPAERRTGTSASSTPSSRLRQDPTPAGDQDPPETMLDGTLGAAYPSFELSSDEAGSTFTCSVDGGPYEPCSSGIDLSHLGPGEHTLRVVATDRHGNSDPTPAVTTWVVRGAGGLGD